MLLWPSYQAEVIFATPPKGGAASPPWLKALLSPRPKWQTGFYLCILTSVCGAECWEFYPKLCKDLEDARWLVELVSVFKKWKLWPLTADSRCWKCPDVTTGVTMVNPEGNSISQPLWEPRGERLARMQESVTFQLWTNPRRHLQMSPFESPHGDRQCMQLWTGSGQCHPEIS